MNPPTPILFLPLLVTALLLSLPAHAGDEKPEASTDKRPATTAEISTKGSVTLLDLHGGIGIVDLTRGGDAWPPIFKVRIHTKGLEGLYWKAGETRIEAFAGQPNVFIGSVKGTVRPSNGETKYAKDGEFYVVHFPKALRDQETVELSWVDFYR